ncbi:hypothetical protein B0T10DRAFT_413998, partial [Thelonectria olida]
FVKVAHLSTVTDLPHDHPTHPSAKRPCRDWIAYILEIRAVDREHVFARVYWMYWPEEIPPQAAAGTSQMHGHPSHYADNELVASNHSESLVWPILVEL